MRNIIVVECKSTGINYIEDIVKMGYNPIVLETKVADTEEGKFYLESMRKGYESIPYDFVLLKEKDTYEETLDMVREYDPLLVIPANEKGVVLASKLAYDLNLLCNDIENLDAMTLKHEMHNRLRECGLRHIRGKNVKTLEEAIDFYDSEGLSEVVIKPIYGAGSTSVKICENREEFIESFQQLADQTNQFGDEIAELLIQERIKGEEYVVNTVSCEGMHRVTTIFKYHKTKTNDGSILYDSMDSVNELNIGEAELVEYAYKVADALKIKYGAVHGEYMVDEKGPVLIEVNCRTMGFNTPGEFLDRLSGQHETDSVLISYLKPELFKEQMKRPYRLLAHASLKLFIIPEDIIAKSAPVKNISIKLKSHFKTLFNDFDDEGFMMFSKTVDMNTSPGTVFLVHKDASVVRKDIEFIRNVERNAFSMVLSHGLDDVELKDDETYINEIKPLIEKYEKYGFGLLVSDQVIDDVSINQVKPEDVDDLIGKFDFLILNINNSIVNKPYNDVINTMWACFSRIKKNGIMFIPKNTYELFEGGRNSAEVLVKTAGLNIELPFYGQEDCIIVSNI